MKLLLMLQVIAGETDTDGMLDVSKSVAQVQPPASLLQAADIVNAAVTRCADRTTG